MFTNMLDTLKLNVISILSRIQVRSKKRWKKRNASKLKWTLQVRQLHKLPILLLVVEKNSAESLSEEELANLNIGRNDPCPCGSGKKYKHCHGNKARYS